jgi:hypothetical protein
VLSIGSVVAAVVGVAGLCVHALREVLPHKTTGAVAGPRCPRRR